MIDNFRTLLIANPRAGDGMLSQRWPTIAAIVARQLGRFQHRFTSAPGEATALARRAADEGYEMVVAVGGDGTINEVINGLLPAGGEPIPAPPVLGVLHFGTGGDFCRGANIPRRLRDGARTLAGRATRPLDAGRVSFVDHAGRPSQRWFANVASFGMSGLVDQIINEGKKSLGGRLSFALATLQAMRRYRAGRATLRFDGSESLDVQLHNVAVANGTCFGGGMRIAPSAQLDDGLFDVVILDTLSWGDLLRHGHRVYRGTHLSLPFVNCKQTRVLEALPINGEAPILLDVDGEAPGRLPATFEIVPAALRLKSCGTSAV